MRSCALLVLVAIAETASARPVPLPNVADDRPRRGRSVVVIGPSTPVRTQAVATTRAQIAALEKRAQAAKGLARIALLDRVLASLEAIEPTDEVLAALTKHAAALAVEPRLTDHAHADELLVRCARLLTGIDDTLAWGTAFTVVRLFPKSPFAADAHLLLAARAEETRSFPSARHHLDTVIAGGRPAFARYARLRRGAVLRLEGDHARALAELQDLVRDPAAQLLHELAVQELLVPYARKGRADLAAGLFDQIERARSAEWLRALGDEYRILGKHREQVEVLRAAIARDADPTRSCFDRADIVHAMIAVPNRIDADVAVAELAAAVAASGDPRCARAADRAAGELAYAWHVALEPKQPRAHVVRAWRRAIPLATTPERKAAAIRNRDLLLTR